VKPFFAKCPPVVGVEGEAFCSVGWSRCRHVRGEAPDRSSLLVRSLALLRLLAQHVHEPAMADQLLPGVPPSSAIKGEWWKVRLHGLFCRLSPACCSLRPFSSPVCCSLCPFPCSLVALLFCWGMHGMLHGERP